MSLANQLLQEAQDRELAAKRAGEDALIQRGRWAKDHLTNLLKAIDLDLGVVFLEAVEGKHPVRRRQQFGGEFVGTDYHRLYRVRIDDVTAAVNAERKKVTLAVESPCPRCGNQAYGKEISITEPQPESQYTMYHADEIRARVLKELGDSLKASPLCWNCQADVGGSCHSCNRAWTPEVWVKDPA